MKRISALFLVLVLILLLVPYASAADNTVLLVDVANQPVTAQAPYVYEGVAETAGTLTVVPSGSPDWGFRVSIDDTEGIMQSGNFADYDWQLQAGQKYKVEVFAYSDWSEVKGSVGLKLTFTPDGGAAVEKKKYIFDQTTAGAPLKAGTYRLTLDQTAVHTLYTFTPDEIGVYTLTVSDGATIGYWGAGSFYVKDPKSDSTSIQREIKSVGQSAVVGIASDSPNVTLTVTKSGESEGIVEKVYIDWVNTHTPSKDLAARSAMVALTAVDIKQAYNVVLGADGFYHLDSASGPVLYVDLKNAEFDLGMAFGSYGALTMRGQFNGVYYNFKSAMSAYNTAITGTGGVYPVTQDIYAFLIGYGNGAGCWYDQKLTCFAEIQAGGFCPESAWMVMCAYGVAPEPEAPAEQTLTLAVGENPVSMVPGVNYVLLLNLPELTEPAGTMAWGSNVTVTADGEIINSPYDLSAYHSSTRLVATVSAQTLDAFVITVPENAPACELVLGPNGVEVTNVQAGTVASFTAGQSGNYVLAAENEINADVHLITATGTEKISLPYRFTLGEGESIQFSVLTLDREAGRVDLLLSEAVSIADGLHKDEDGNFYYYLDGKVADHYTGLVANDFGSWYIKEGMAQLSYDGLITFHGTKYLIKAGRVNQAFTGITKQEGVYYYFTSGVNDVVFDGLVYCNGMKAYVQNGEVNFNMTGIVREDGAMRYVKYGIWRNTFNGLARKDDGNWIYMRDGTFDASFTGVAKLNTMWVYVNEGYVDFKFSGVYNVDGVDYIIQYGVVRF